MNEEQIKNKQLIEEYPFLLPKNVFSGDVPEDYDYSYTLLDEIPQGWLNSFIPDFLKELKEALIKDNLLDDYFILQIKEKWGYLHWYDNGRTESVDKIITKYEKISQDFCIRCGKKATKMTSGWITYVCDACYDNPNW